MLNPDWAAGLRASKVFLCLVTPAYLRNPECWEQLALARRLQKPCRALIKHGTPVPPEFFDGFDDLRTYTFRTRADLRRLSRQLAAELGDGDVVDGGV